MFTANLYTPSPDIANGPPAPAAEPSATAPVVPAPPAAEAATAAATAERGAGGERGGHAAVAGKEDKYAKPGGPIITKTCFQLEMCGETQITLTIDIVGADGSGSGHLTNQEAAEAADGG